MRHEFQITFSSPHFLQRTLKLKLYIVKQTGNIKVKNIIDLRHISQKPVKNKQVLTRATAGQVNVFLPGCRNEGLDSHEKEEHDEGADQVGVEHFISHLGELDQCKDRP